MKRLLAVWIVVIVLAFPVGAQNIDIESLSGLQFNFSNPGARSLSMGGAFLGLADDATAAEANPAGLMTLTRPEVSLELRSSSAEQTFANSGRFPDTTTRTIDSNDDVNVNFASVIYPRARFSLGVFYNQPLDFTWSSGDSLIGDFGPDGLGGIQLAVSPDSNGIYRADPSCTDVGDAGCVSAAITPYISNVSVKAETLGVVAAVRFGKLSLGGTVRRQEFTGSSSASRFFDAETFVFSASQTADDSDTTFVGGFLWEAATWFTVGGVYKQGAEFDTTNIERFNTQDDETGEFTGVIEMFDIPCTYGTPAQCENGIKFHIPDTYGIGVTVSPIQRLKVSADVVRVTYSNQSDDFVATFGPSEDFETPDVTEVHLGAEWLAFATPTGSLAIRAGWWRDPDHTLRYTGEVASSELEEALIGTALQILFPRGEDTDHVSAGIGVTRGTFSLDLGADYSDRGTSVAVSAVKRF